VLRVTSFFALFRGIPITDVSRWLGHKSTEVTHRIYGHLVPGSWKTRETSSTPPTVMAKPAINRSVLTRC
jgi:hypothetical protein